MIDRYVALQLFFIPCLLLCASLFGLWLARRGARRIDTERNAAKAAYAETPRLVLVSDRDEEASNVASEAIQQLRAR